MNHNFLVIHRSLILNYKISWQSNVAAYGYQTKTYKFQTMTYKK